MASRTPAVVSAMSARGGMALNPTSVPFFPSTFNAESVERSRAGSGLGFRLPLGMHELQRTESSNLSQSTSSFRSASSSPSSSAPAPDGRNGMMNSLTGSGSPSSVGPAQQLVGEENRKNNVIRYSRNSFSSFALRRVA